GDVYRVLSDQLGSPRLVVNVADDTDVLLEAEYSAFGERTVVGGDADGLTLGFAGGIHDADTGLTRFGARDYDPEVGRWAGKEPLRFGAPGTNFYSYTVGDPVNFLDADGQYACPLILGAIALVAVTVQQLFFNEVPDSGGDGTCPLPPPEPDGNGAMCKGPDDGDDLDRDGVQRHCRERCYGELDNKSDAEWRYRRCLRACMEEYGLPF